MKGHYIIRLQSKYKKYSWNAVKLSLEDSLIKISEHNYKFNLPYILHENDVLQVYLEKFVDGKLKIEKMPIDSVYLKRK